MIYLLSKLFENNFLHFKYHQLIIIYEKYLYLHMTYETGLLVLF